MDTDIQTITLLGHLITDAEPFSDKNGNDFIRFKMACMRATPKGESKFTVYRILYYGSGFENLKQGDQVYVFGDLDINAHIDKEGKVWLNNEVYALKISRGQTAVVKVERRKNSDD